MFGMQVCDARTSAGNGVAVESNIQKYQAFLQTVRLGSITRAARSLDYSQSGVSRMVADLERAWGVSLLERGHGGVRLTAEGERLLPFVEEVCEGARRLSMQVDDINGLETGTVRIGTFSSVATHWLPRIIKRFQRDFPNIEYEMLLGDFPEIERWCEEGRVDLGFLPYAPAPASLGARWLEDDELLAVLPEGHELATTSAPVPLARLCEEPFIMLEQSGDEEVRSVFARAVSASPPLTTTRSCPWSRAAWAWPSFPRSSCAATPTTSRCGSSTRSRTARSTWFIATSTACPWRRSASSATSTTAAVEASGFRRSEWPQARAARDLVRSPFPVPVQRRPRDPVRRAPLAQMAGLT